MAEADIEFQRRLEEVHRAYVQRLPVRLTEILQCWSALREQKEVDALIPLHRAVHSLIGSAGTFGHEPLSETARRVEQFLRPIKESRRLPSDEECIRAETLLSELEQAVRTVTGS